MNERIKELVIQAGEYANSVWVDPTKEDHVSWHDLYNEKFAELIIRDCAKIATVYSEYGVERTGGAAIREHFGIDE